MQSFAVSVVSEKPLGQVRHTLSVIEAKNIDAAEGRVLHQMTSAGHVIRHLLTLPSVVTVSAGVDAL